MKKSRWFVMAVLFTVVLVGVVSLTTPARAAPRYSDCQSYSQAVRAETYANCMAHCMFPSGCSIGCWGEASAAAAGAYVDCQMASGNVQ